MTDEDNTLKEIEAQRSDILNKLTKIEEKKTTVSPEVYEKVKKEYEEKLAEVEKKLAENVELIKKKLEGLKSKEEQILKNQKEIKLKLEEVELRYSIGEYDEETYNQVKEENQKVLDEINGELNTIQEKIKWFSSFLEVKDIEENIEPTEEFKIEEHILGEEIPEEVKLDEILPEVEAIKPEPVTEEKAQEEEKKPASEEGVACPKCGHINTPDSWYCEKCGAEILGAPGS